MNVGVPKETAQAERRVALIPDMVASLRDRKLDVVVESGAGVESGHPDEEYTEAGATIGDPWGADIVVHVAVPTADEIGKLKQGQILDRPPRAADLGRYEQGPRQRRGDELRDGGDPADHARAGDGRALLPGKRRRLRRDAARRARGWPLLPDDDHRRRHREAGAGAGARRRCRRPAGDRDREAAWRRGLGLRHPPRRLGADRVARRAPARARTSSPTPRTRAATRAR